jgi:hypothetical protein
MGVSLAISPRQQIVPRRPLSEATLIGRLTSLDPPARQLLSRGLSPRRKAAHRAGGKVMTRRHQPQRGASIREVTRVVNE